MQPDDDKTRTHVPLTEGTMVSHYRIIEKIGAGGMGEVYLAEDTQLNRKVALKFLPSHLCQDEDCRKRFTREAQAAAKLAHPNIVTIHEVSEFNGRPYFSMEHIEGKSLREVIRQGDLSPAQATGLAIQLCEGLQEAHSAGIIHRDIKPSNIIIDRKGRSRILDFGLATIRQTEKLTRVGSTLGTVPYMSPEQTRGEEIDHRSDIFSLGVVLYEMITGRLPFKGEHEPAIINSISHDEPEPLSRYKSGVPDALQRIINKALAKDKNLRYQHADDMMADLRALQTEDAAVAHITPHRDWWNRYVVVGAVLILIVIAGYWLLADSGLMTKGKKSPERKMLVVLPFQNLGASDDEYFADGITDEITSRLGVIKGLGVISRTSAMQYKNTNKGLPQIAKELAVDYVLEGTIRWDKSGDTNLVRITPQLIKASDNTHVWAGNYERALKSVFAVQAEIAACIADTLGLTLLEPERKSLEAKPTDNLEAYGFYLRGKEYWEDTRSATKAIPMIEKAVVLDSNFCQAYSLLARLCGFAYINNLPGRKEWAEKAKTAAERAFHLAAGKPEGYLALGSYYYFVNRDYDRALELYHKALEGQPNNSDLLAAIGYVQRRQGKWEEAAASLQKAFQLDPGSVVIADGLARSTLLMMHRLNDAEIVIDRALEMAPDNEVLLPAKALLRWYDGDSLGARASLNRLEQVADRSYFAFWAEIADIAMRDFESALRRRTSLAINHPYNDSVSYYLRKGDIYMYLDNNDAGKNYYDSARIVCQNKVLAEPDNADARISLAQAYAGLGRKQDAIREGEKAIELLPITEDALSGAVILADLALVYVMVGEFDKAIDQLDYLLSIPSYIQVEELRRHPNWDPLRNNPRFQKLPEKYGT